MNKYLSISLSIAIFLIFAYTLFENALNAPSFDDYDTTINFIQDFYFKNHSFESKADILLSRHNEHRILFSKSCAALYYYFFKQINFRHLVIFQNIFLLGFFGLMLFILKSRKLLLPETALWSSLFLFSLSFWQVTFYYWGGIQHYTVFFFCFLSLFLLGKSEKPISGNFFTAILSAIFAVLSFGNGFLVLFLGAFILFASKKHQLLTIWILFSTGLLLFTFWPALSTGGNGLAGTNLNWMARLLLTFLGSFVYINPSSGQPLNIVVCMIVGLGVILTWFWLFLKGYAFKNPVLYCLLSLPILTGIIVAISRFESKAAGGIAPRYMFFTATIPVLLVVILMDLQILKIRHLKAISFAGLLIWAASFYNNRNATVLNNSEITANLDKWSQDRNTRLIYYKSADEYSKILNWALTQKVLSIPNEKSKIANDSK